MSLALVRRPRPRPRAVARWQRYCPCLEELESRLAPSANVAVTTDPGVQQMPSVAVDPHDASHIAIAYQDYSLLRTGYAGIGVGVSHDGGATWQHSSVSLPAGFDQGADDPIVQFDTQGHVFVSFMAATFVGTAPPITDLGGALRALGFQSSNGIFVARSDDGGLTWNQPVTVASDLYDGTDPVFFELKPDLAIDTFAHLPNGQPNPYYGSLYVSWSRYYPPGQFPGDPNSTGGSNLILAVSKDAGLSWQLAPQPVAVNVNDKYNSGEGWSAGFGDDAYPQVTVGPQGDIYVVLGSGEVSVYHSTDDGASFTQPNNATQAGYPLGTLLLAVQNPTLTNDHFRLQTIRDIAADPTRPGYVYAVAPVEVTNGNGTIVDPADVLFARSTDYGGTWQTTFQVGSSTNAGVLNDDNFGQSTTGAPNDVANGQAMPRLVTDAQGDIGVIWYDTRRDPADVKLDVFGTFSGDGGKTFSANFRITDQSFDPNAGQFTAADGSTSYYMGDWLGLVLANHTAYAAWTDTRNGNQDIFFSRYPINPPPPPPSNRFAPNDTAALATDLGPVAKRSLPKLTIAAGDKDWFRVQAAATGSLTVSATLAAPGDSVRLELFDASGAALLATGTTLLGANGRVTGQTLTFPGQSGQTYLVEVLPGPAAHAGSPAVYTLSVQSLTADLGAQVYGVQTGSLAPGVNAYYALTAPAAGSLEVILTLGANVQGNFHLQLLDPNDLSNVLASGQAAGTALLANLAVTQGQAVYLHVYGDDAARGDFSLEFTNLDQYATPDNQTLFFPTGGNPSQVALADLTGNGKQDIVVDYADQNFVSVLLNNRDGTFQAPRDYAVGAFQAGNISTAGGVPNYKREMVIADFNGDGIPDLAVLNYQSATASLLLGRGDGTFAPQRLIATVGSPFALAAGDLNNDGITDLVVVGSTGDPAMPAEVLLGRGDGTFQPPIPFTIPSTPFPAPTIQIADLNHDGKYDLVYEGSPTVEVLLGNGDGTFGSATQIGPGYAGGLAVADLTGNGKQDVVTTEQGITAGGIDYWLGNGDGTFPQRVSLPAGQDPIAVAVADVGSQVTLPDGSIVLGPADGHPDLIVADIGQPLVTTTGPPQIVVLPGLVDAQGHFNGFGAPITLAPAVSPLDLKVADLTGDGSLDVVAAEIGGIEVIYGKKPDIPPNTTPQTARKLGTVVHIVEPAQTIVPGHEDSYFTLAAPTEDARGAGDEILDFSGGFQGQGGAGLGMEVRDAQGRLLASGARFRVVVPQDAALTLHVYGAAGGTGAYTLDIDALPQLVSTQAEPLLPGASADPGGPTASLVLTFQGDRLDPTTAEDPADYTVTWVGPDGNRVIPVQAVGQPAVYDPGANIDVATGITYPTAVRQTVTLLFDQPLPPGSYFLDLSPAILVAPFNPGEDGLLAPAPGVTGHTVASTASGAVTEGDDRFLPGLVTAGGPPGDFSAFKAGTPFLTQLHDDLGAILDADLTAQGDAAGISAGIDQQIVDRFTPALGPAGASPLDVLVIWLDPVTVDLYGPDRRSQVSYDLRSNSYQNSFATAFASVVGNVELLVLPFVPVRSENYLLSVQPSLAARGGAAVFGPDGAQVQSLTAALRAGTDQFVFSFLGPAPPPPPPAAPAPSPSAPRSADPPVSIATLFVVSDARPGRLSLLSLAPLEFPVVGRTAAAVGIAAAAGSGAPLSGAIVGRGLQGNAGADLDGPVDRAIEVVSRVVGRLFPGLGASMGRWLRGLWRAGARWGAGAALARPAGVAVVAADPVRGEAVPATDGAEVPVSAGGGRWSWAVLLGLVGGLLLPGALRPGNKPGDRKRPRLP